jgi:hypothetical protein
MYSVLRSAKVGIGPNKNRSKLMTVCKIVVKPGSAGSGKIIVFPSKNPVSARFWGME